MAWIRKRELANGEARYDVGHRGPDGSVHWKTFRRRKDADNFKRRMETDLERGS